MKKQIGHVGVDAGCIWIGDPCYILGDDASHRVETWHGFCDLLFKNPDHDENGYSNPLGEGIGMVVQTAYGDGVYPVYANIDPDGRIMSITVDFS